MEEDEETLEVDVEDTEADDEEEKDEEGVKWSAAMFPLDRDERSPTDAADDEEEAFVDDDEDG